VHPEAFVIPTCIVIVHTSQQLNMLTTVSQKQGVVNNQHFPVRLVGQRFKAVYDNAGAQKQQESPPVGSGRILEAIYGVLENSIE
jgi:hypothetical protein